MSPQPQPDTPRPERHRRSHRRYPINVELEYKLLDGSRVVKTGSGLTVNLSSGGILFACEDALPLGATARLTLTWPVRLNERAGLNLCVTGKIVRSSGNYAALAIKNHEFRTRPFPFAAHAPKTFAAGAVMTARFSSI